MTPHSVGRCPKDRGDRSQLGKPFFKRVFLNITCKNFCKSITLRQSKYSYLFEQFLSGFKTCMESGFGFGIYSLLDSLTDAEFFIIGNEFGHAVDKRGEF